MGLNEKKKNCTVLTGMDILKKHAPLCVFGGFSNLSHIFMSSQVTGYSVYLAAVVVSPPPPPPPPRCPCPSSSLPFSFILFLR